MLTYKFTVIIARKGFYKSSDHEGKDVFNFIQNEKNEGETVEIMYGGKRIGTLENMEMDSDYMLSACIREIHGNPDKPDEELRHIVAKITADVTANTDSAATASAENDHNAVSGSGLSERRSGRTRKKPRNR